jgi:hypothetical protein
MVGVAGNPSIDLIYRRHTTREIVGNYDLNLITVDFTPVVEESQRTTNPDCSTILRYREFREDRREFLSQPIGCRVTITHCNTASVGPLP